MNSQQVNIETILNAPRRRRKGERAVRKPNPTNSDLGLYKDATVQYLIPYGIIYVASNASRFDAGDNNDPWVTPTLASINIFFKRCMETDVDFGEDDPVPFVVRGKASFNLFIH